MILGTALFLASTGNFGFFRATLAYYPAGEEWPGLVSLFGVLTCCLFLALRILCFGRLTKPVLAFALLSAAPVNYFTNSFGIVMDHNMILNVINTDPREVRDLLNSKLAAYVFFLGLIPSLFVWKVELLPASGKQKFLSYGKGIVLSLLFTGILAAPFGKFYASFLREHKELRTYINPLYLYYSTGKYAASFMSSATGKLASLGLDSLVSASDHDRDLVILVVGETARADHFSLNGYKRKTNPMLEQLDVISFSAMSSCGTSTAVSVPCMFSPFGRDGFSDSKAKSNENLLDLLAHTKRVNVLWRDNNSDSKGVAVRAAYQDFRDPKLNSECDEECRDPGMLKGLQEYIDAHPEGDFLIVLHQMGNHGPAYYKRYPKDFETFKPACHDKQLERCTQEEIVNAYDNAVLYTDFFLARTIDFLKGNSGRFETAMFYVSDHGESLGERGLYLHGLPYLIAPEEQKRVASVVWLGEEMKKDLNYGEIKAKASQPISHDNVFHSVLGLFEIESSVYRKELDIFSRKE